MNITQRLQDARATLARVQIEQSDAARVHKIVQVEFSTAIQAARDDLSSALLERRAPNSKLSHEVNRLQSELKEGEAKLAAFDDAVRKAEDAVSGVESEMAANRAAFEREQFADELKEFDKLLSLAEAFAARMRKKLSQIDGGANLTSIFTPIPAFPEWATGRRWDALRAVFNASVGLLNTKEFDGDYRKAVKQ